MAKILISAGEASGDIHAAAVTAALKKIDSTTEVFGMGGDELRAAGGEVLFDIKDHGVMGFVEVIKKLPDLFKLRSDFAKVMDERKPDCLVVVDYPGFNMKLAKLAHDKGIPVVSYIAPSAWAWNKGRAKNVAKIVDKVACIFPFEYDSSLSLFLCRSSRNISAISLRFSMYREIKRFIRSSPNPNSSAYTVVFGLSLLFFITIIGFSPVILNDLRIH